MPDCDFGKAVLATSDAGRCSFKVASCVTFPSLKIVTSCVAVPGPEKVASYATFSLRFRPERNSIDISLNIVMKIVRTSEYTLISGKFFSCGKIVQKSLLKSAKKSHGMNQTMIK